MQGLDGICCCWIEFYVLNGLLVNKGVTVKHSTGMNTVIFRYFDFLIFILYINFVLIYFSVKVISLYLQLKTIPGTTEKYILSM